MKYQKIKNEFTLTVITFGVVGFVLLVGVMFFHKPINAQLTIAQEGSSVAINVPNPIPDEIIKEITQDGRNIAGYESSEEMFKPLTPAMRFLHTISSDNLFLTQE